MSVDTMRPPEPHEGARQIAIIGTGYVGLVTAACLASMGHEVDCVDRDVERVHRLRLGILPIREPGLAELVDDGLESGRLRFSSDLNRVAGSAEMAFIAIAALEGADPWSDPAIAAVLDDLLALAEVPPLLVVRSTLRPGRMRQLQERVRASGRPTTLALQPDFTREGTAIADFFAPDRVVVGLPPNAEPGVADPLLALYGPLDAPFLLVDHATAEVITIGSNAFLAAKITFANELTRLCRAVGADSAAVRHGLGLDPRIGEQSLTAGPGFGGASLPSQIDLLTEMSSELNLGLQVIPAVGRFNREQAVRIAAEVSAILPRDPLVAILGLAFKAGTDDVRLSPALAILDALETRGVARLTAFDPSVRALPARPDVHLLPTPYAAAEGAHALVVGTEWPVFARLDWNHLASVVAQHEVYDARGVIDVQAATAAGFRVQSLERQPQLPTAILEFA